MSEKERKKKCFVITPIGDKGTEIRRHIDGIIDAAISPVIEEEFDYKLEVSHRIDDLGSIPKQVITSIHESDLVIANLTGNNPNVMYELALRHCFGTVVIMIAEKGTQIPSDIVSERTIFYDNDAQGVLELREELRQKVLEIENREVISQIGPVYDALRDKLTVDNVMRSIKSDESADIFSVLLNKLEDLEREVRRHSSVKESTKKQFIDIVPVTEDKEFALKILTEEIDPLFRQLKKPWRYRFLSGKIRIFTDVLNFDEMKILQNTVYSAFNKHNIKVEGITHTMY